MPASQAQQAQTSARRAKAAQLRIAGLSFQAIADQLGYADRASAQKDIRRSLARNRADERYDIQEYRELELERLDRVQAAIWPKALSGDVSAVNAFLRISDRRWKTLGFEKTEVVQVFNLEIIDAEIVRLRSQLASLNQPKQIDGHIIDQADE